MTLDEIDRELERWQKDIQSASSNLSAFDSSTSCQLLKQAIPTLTGKSKTKLGDPLLNMKAIWEQFSLANDTVKQAFTLRQDMPLIIGRGDRIKKIEYLLCGQSVCAQIKEIPLEQRGLTGSGQTVEKTTLTNLFCQMKTEFAAATEAAATYEKLSTELLDKVNQAIDEIDKSFEIFPGVKEKLETVRDLIYSDPIGAQEQFKAINRKPKTVTNKIHRLENDGSVKTLTWETPVKKPSEPIIQKQIEKPLVQFTEPVKPPTIPSVTKTTQPTKVDPKVDTDSLSKLLKPKIEVKPETPKDKPTKSLEDLFKRKDKK